MDGLIFGAVIAARVLVPLAIPRFPLPAMLAALVIDGLDQTIFQTFTRLDLEGYQTYDKALDVYYLSIAYTATLRNWTHHTAIAVGRFLYYFRLVGVVLFELTQIRALLLVFPNTFEYLFDLYEAIRARWDPRRLSDRSIIGAAAFIWIVVKLPQEWWIHVAKLDATDLLKRVVFGVPLDASWIDAVAARPIVLGILAVIVVALVGLARWLVVRRLPPADHPLTLDADEGQPVVEPAAVERERRRLSRRLFDRELVEKTALIALVSIIFGRMLPGVDATPLETAIGIAIIIVVNTAITEALVRQGASWQSAVTQFVVML
ncbi:MAG TPA: hypothetical protein VK867_02235, partial [Candidatus Limnocylindrales bacterium]|nr:hypothetical protein [Candidatus Limnocylindrales bacterium]